MKTILTLFLILIVTVSAIAQPPQKLTYQAVIRNGNNDLVTNQPVGIRISILQGSPTGTVVYAETQNPITNANGLISIAIGSGTVVSGNFITIDWPAGPFFIKTEVDAKGGTNYTITAVSELLSVPYALHAKTVSEIADNSVTSLKIADGVVGEDDLAANAVTADKIQNGAVTTDKLANGSVTGAKIAQAGAISGQVLKWSGSTWAPATDATGGGGGGWTDDGNIIRLTTTTDSVQMGSVNRLGKFNVGGNIGLNVNSSIYFGSDATRITGMTGGDMRMVAEDLSMLTTEDITFGHFGDVTWIKFDNANKRVGIGTLTPTDRLHVVLNETSEGLSAIRGVAAATAGSAYGIYGQAAGYKGRAVMGEATGTNSIGLMGLATNTSSTGVWGEGSNQGVYGTSDMATGKGVFGQVASATGYSGFFDGGKFYVSGNVGIGTTSPAKKLHVNGSAQVKDTLYAKAVKIANSPRVFYKKASSSKTVTAQNSWGPLDTITVEAPGPGYVILNFTGALMTNHTYLDNCDVGVGISTRPTSGVLAQTWWSFTNQFVGGVYDTPCAVNTVAEITAAGTYNYYIVGYHWGVVGDNDEDVEHLNGGSFSALFIPSP